MQPARDKIQKCLDDLKLKKKLQSLYIICVILPLILTDGFILYSVLSAEKVQQHSMVHDHAAAVSSRLFLFHLSIPFVFRSVSDVSVRLPSAAADTVFYGCSAGLSD